MISSGINLQQARLLSDAYEVGPPDFDDFSGIQHLMAPVFHLTCQVVSGKF